MRYSESIVRVLFFLVFSFYSAGLIFSYSTYLIWQDYVPFFNYVGISLEEVFILIVFVFIGSIFMPSKLKNASDIFVWVLFLFLYLPVYIFYMGSSNTVSMFDSIVYLVVAVSFLLVALPSYLMRRKIVFDVSVHGLPDKRIITYFLFFWFVLLLVVLQKYMSVMSLRGLDQVYIQRVLGKADSLFYGYAQVYFGYVLSIALVGLGFFYKKKVSVLVGVFGCVILYSITAERTIFILPVFVYLVYRLVSTKNQTFWMIFFICFLGVYFFFIGFCGDYNKLFKDFGFYILTRVVAIPGLFFVDYLNYFNEVGYTNFSHVKGFNLFFSASPALAQDPLFPELGRIVARDVHGINSNSNASFLSTDGVAGFGLIGVLIVSFFLSGVLFLINLLAKNWPVQLVVPLMAPMALTLTNGSLFTVLLSFGLLFWMSVFLFSRISIRH